MTRWSLRRRHGVTKDAQREYGPATAVPVPGRPSADPLPVTQPSAQPAPSGQSASSQQNLSWFEPGRGRSGQPGPAQSGTVPYGPGEPGGAAQYLPSEPASSLFGGQYGPSSYSATQQGAAQQGTSKQGTSKQGASQQGGSQTGGRQYWADPYGERQSAGGVTVLAPVKPPAAPPAPPAPRAAPAAEPESLPATTLADLMATDQATPKAGNPWPDICDQFGLHLLVLAEQLRTSLDELEADEANPERLKRLYQVDHAVTRMRRASRDLRTLAGRSEEELAGFTTSLLDVIRMAASAIERYTQVTIGKVTDLAVLGYAADDIGSVMAALLDNATRYSPGTVSVSGHLLDDGGVMFRIEDTGIGMGTEQVAALNAAFVGPVPDVDERTGRHTGFPVVHRIARKHSIGVRLAARPLPSSGMVAMVTLPPHLLCEIPGDEAQRRAAAAAPAAPPTSPRSSPVHDLPRGESARGNPPPKWAPPELPNRDAPNHDPSRLPQRQPSDLPRRQRASLRGDEPRPEKQAPGMVPTAEQQAAARRAFADDITAFSLGTGGSAVIGGPAGNGDLKAADKADKGEDAATTGTEEKVQP